MATHGGRVPRYFAGTHGGEPPSDCGKWCFPICEIYRHDGCAPLPYCCLIGSQMAGACAAGCASGFFFGSGATLHGCTGCGSTLGGCVYMCALPCRRSADQIFADTLYRFAVNFWHPKQTAVDTAPSLCMKIFCPMMEVCRYEKNPCDGGGNFEPFIIPYCCPWGLSCLYTTLCWSPQEVYGPGSTFGTAGVIPLSGSPVATVPVALPSAPTHHDSNPMASAILSPDMDRGLQDSDANALPLGWEERSHPSGSTQYYNIQTQETTFARPAPPPAAKSPTPLLASAVQAAPATSADLTSALREASLSQYEAALRELGCATASDLQDLEEGDLLEIGLKKLEIRRCACDCDLHIFCLFGGRCAGSEIRCCPIC